MPTNPLFPRAAEAIRKAALREFQSSDLGKLVALTKQAATGSRTQARASEMLERFARDPGRTLRQMAGTDFGQFVRQVEHYARGGTTAKDFVNELIQALGPIGGMIKSLIAPKASRKGRWPSLRREVEAAANFLEAFGDNFGVKVQRQKPSVLPKRPGDIGPAPTSAEMERKLREARELLEAAGHTVLAPDEEPPIRSTPPLGISPTTKTGSPRKVVDIEIDGRKRRLPIEHPLISGHVVYTPQSSNVHSFNYDIENWWLHVRFQNPDGGAGPLYRYFNVAPKLYLSMLDAPSKGTWVWDHLRVRGTVSGHQVDYALVGVTNAYVPRKATLRPDGEWYVGRTVRSKAGKTLSSQHPDRLVRALQPVNRAAPKRPNTGRK